MTMKIEHRTLHMLGKYSTIELLPFALQYFVLFKFKYTRVLLRLTAPLRSTGPPTFASPMRGLQVCTTGPGFQCCCRKGKHCLMVKSEMHLVRQYFCKQV